MGIERLIEGRSRDLGGLTVQRLLPAPAQQMVGPFIFLDHIGPAELLPGAGLDVRPHPHIALATVTYLYEGALLHRDSLGCVQEIRPGDVNWMSAGRGITHSERSPAAERVRGVRLHGLQSWVALPDGQEETAPEFHHHPAASLPAVSLGEAELRIIAGEAFGRRSPVDVRWPTLYVDVLLAAGGRLDLPPEYSERAVCVVGGEIEVGNIVVDAHSLAVLAAEETITVRARSTARFMFFGGERFPTPRFIWWNFVASSRKRLEEARRDWAEGRFAHVTGDDELMPAPKS